MGFGSLFQSESRSETLSSAANVIEGDGDTGSRETLNLSGIKIGRRASFAVTTSDFGAIEAGRQTSRDAIGLATSANQSVTNIARSSQEAAERSVASALNLVENRSQSEAAEGIGQLFNLGMVAVVVVGAVLIFKG